MVQTKRQKQEKALSRLLAELQGEKESRASLQTQSYRLIEPSENEFRISREINNLKRSLGLSFQAEECPF